jgi:hypothetical protein
MTVTEHTAPTAEGRLTSGWEADLRLDDTLVRHYTFALAAGNAAPARAMGGRILERDDLLAADLGRPNAIFNAAVLTRPPAADGWHGALDEVEAFFAGGTGRAYLWSPWPTPDLRDRGWQLDGHPPLLVRPPGLALPEATAALVVREVADGAGLADFERVLVDGFPFDEHGPADAGRWLDERLLAEPGHRLFVGYADGAAAAAGWLLVHGGLGVLVLGATLAEHRQRGYWTAMLRRRLEAAREVPTASIFGDMSRPIAERHGFLPLVRYTLWHRDRSP